MIKKIEKNCISEKNCIWIVNIKKVTQVIKFLIKLGQFFPECSNKSPQIFYDRKTTDLITSGDKKKALIGTNFKNNQSPPSNN